MTTASQEGVTLFTTVCDFDGGTYVSQQLEAKDAVEAIQLWSKALQRDEFIPKQSIEIAKLFEKDARGEFPPVALAGLLDVWQSSVTIDDKHCTVTLIRCVNR